METTMVQNAVMILLMCVSVWLQILKDLRD